MTLHPTPSQTAGPFLSLGLAHLCCSDVVLPIGGDTRIAVTGRVLDGNGQAVSDVAIEVWQAAADGTYDSSGARGFGRICPGDDGQFAFTTVRPGRVPGPGGTLQAPHLAVTLFMRGLLRHLSTRMYFPDDTAHDEDPVLALVPAHRRQTLIARTAGERNALRWDVVLQGDDETVFFEW